MPRTVTFEFSPLEREVIRKGLELNKEHLMKFGNLYGEDNNPGVDYEKYESINRLLQELRY